MIGKNTRAYEGNEENAEPEGMARKEYEQKCTHPELREDLLEDQASTKGGKPGRRSARKAQPLTQEYEKRGDCKGEKDESQEVLKK